MLVALAYLTLGVGLAVAVVVSVGRLLKVQIYPFLAVHAPLKADALVVEGWLPDYALAEVAAEFHRGEYQTIIIVGEPLRYGYFLTQYKSYAYLAAATLECLGIQADKIVAIPMPLATRDRTQTAALFLRQWLFTHNVTIQAVNLYSLGAHARRSWRSFRQALHPEVQVGVMAGLPQDYDPDRWWDYSAGVRSILSETIGYAYAWLPRSAHPQASQKSVAAFNPEE
jgi:hypothetical protein